jgi:hypothetical protein
MTLEQYTNAKAYAHYEHRWERCDYAFCRKTKSCKGGPRGTLRKLQGKTRCETLPPKPKPVDFDAIPEFSNSNFIQNRMPEHKQNPDE